MSASLEAARSCPCWNISQISASSLSRSSTGRTYDFSTDKEARPRNLIVLVLFHNNMNRSIVVSSSSGPVTATRPMKWKGVASYRGEWKDCGAGHSQSLDRHMISRSSGRVMIAEFGHRRRSACSNALEEIRPGRLKAERVEMAMEMVTAVDIARMRLSKAASG